MAKTTKSFKENYDDLRAAPVSLTDEITPDSIMITPTVLPDPVVEINDATQLPKTEVQPLPITEVLTEEIIKDVLAEQQTLNEKIIQDILTEHQEQIGIILESVTKSNTEATNSLKEIIKNNTKKNKKLLDDITRLIEKVEEFETKLGGLQTISSTKIIKRIHRDDDGLIDYVTESTIAEDKNT